MSAIRDFFNKPMTPDRQRMIMELVQAGMASAGGGSPLASFLAPIAGSAIAGSAMNRAEQYAGQQGQQSQAAMASILGDRANDPRITSALQIMNNPNSPAGARAIAEAQVSRMMQEMFPPIRRGGGGGGGGGGGRGGTRLTGEFNVGGYLYGRDNAGGMRPYIDHNGEMISVDPNDRSMAVLNPQSPDEPEVAPPSSNNGGGMLSWLWGRGADEPPNDPLGILDRPPA